MFFWHVLHCLQNPDATKAKLISRMARMGQPMLPFIAGPASSPSQPDSSDSELEARLTVSLQWSYTVSYQTQTRNIWHCNLCFTFNKDIKYINVRECMSACGGLQMILLLLQDPSVSRLKERSSAPSPQPVHMTSAPPPSVQGNTHVSNHILMKASSLNV